MELTEARSLARWDVTDDVDLVSLLLGLLDLAINPVQVTPRIVKVEHQPKVEVVAEVGVHGEEAEAGAHQHLWREVSELIFFPIPSSPECPNTTRPGKGAQPWGQTQIPLGHPVVSLLQSRVETFLPDFGNGGLKCCASPWCNFGWEWRTEMLRQPMVQFWGGQQTEHFESDSRNLVGMFYTTLY